MKAKRYPASRAVSKQVAQDYVSSLEDEQPELSQLAPEAATHKKPKRKKARRYLNTKQTYLPIKEKYLADPNALSEKELKLFVNGMPNRLRTSRSHEEIVHLFESDALTLDILRSCSMIDLNRSIRMLCKDGHIGTAAKLVDHLLQSLKFNQHTFAMFFDGCAMSRDLSMAMRFWVVWAKVCFQWSRIVPSVVLFSNLNNMFL